MDMEKHVGYVLNADIRRKWQQQIKQAEEAMAMYKSPIEIMLTEMQVKMENGIMKAVQDVGVNADATELLKALVYDRGQYKKGYADGLEAGLEWISVEERMPKDQEIVLLGYAGNLTDCGYYDEEEAEWCNYESIKVESPTHWMPKPEPPKEG